MLGHGQRSRSWLGWSSGRRLWGLRKNYGIRGESWDVEEGIVNVRKNIVGIEEEVEEETAVVEEKVTVNKEDVVETKEV